MALPDTFCWSRVGTESGEELEEILARKEHERIGNKGIFLWGIGSAIGPSIEELVRLHRRPEVVFSPIRSVPRNVDAHPERIAVWLSARGLTGGWYDIPARSIITSRFPQEARRACHYALVCQSNKPLQFDEAGELIEFGRLRNLRSDRPIGASQVTAVVKQVQTGRSNKTNSYRAVVRATLVFPYLVRLENPLEVPREISQSVSDAKARTAALLQLVYQHGSQVPRTFG